MTKKKFKKSKKKITGNATIAHMDSVDFNTEYNYLLSILKKPKDEIKTMDLSSPGYRAWLLFVRARREEKEIKLQIRIAEGEILKPLLAATKRGQAKPTDKQMKTLYVGNPMIGDLVRKASEWDDIKEACEGLANAFGIKKRHRYERDKDS